MKNQFTSRWFAGCDPVHIPVTRITRVVINIDENLPLRNTFGCAAQPFETCTIRRDYAIELMSLLGLADQLFAIEKRELRRQRIMVPTRDLLSRVQQRQRQPELRTDAIAIGPDVA